jgi:NAD-dependent dihydropyrimidine dehydrogenase PreA subunit
MIEITQKEQCCGCSACVHICPKHSISFQEDKEGFLYPKVDLETCVDCGLCEKVCPIINQDPEREPQKVYAAKNYDESIRLKSSSGGVFTLLAEKIIGEGGVVFGARFNENWEVIHDYTDTIEGLEPFRGSKYVQSAIGESYKQAKSFLNAGRKVMFTGTPCQIAGLKKFLRKGYENLLTVDFVCHGVPSPLVWRMYLKEEIGRQGKVEHNTGLATNKDAPVLTGVNFRDKSHGWKKYSVVLNFLKASAAGEVRSVLSSVFTDNDYMRAFLANLSLRPSCYNCPAKAGKSGADITIGDFWGIENILPDLNDDRGMSVLVNYSEIKCLPLISELYLHSISYPEILVCNPCLVESVDKPVNRGFFFSQLMRKGFNYAVNSTFCTKFISRLIRYAYRMMA